MTAGTTKIVMTSTTSGAPIYYTLDGTDPRYSPNKMLYTGGESGIATTGWTEATTVKAYAVADSLFASGVSEATYSVSA